MPKKGTKRTKQSKTKTSYRASWKGALSFGLVSFQVEAFNAHNRDESDIHFHQLHAKCHRRIQYRKVCPTHGELSPDEIVSGYEVSKGHYVEIDSDELVDLRTESERALTIDAFVAPDSIDPLYYDGRMYYLLPAVSSAETPYGVLVTAMEREGIYGVGQVVFSGKDQVVLLRVVGKVLHMAMLNYEAEIRSPESMSTQLKTTSGQTRQIKLAQTLIRDWAVDDFDFSQYVDTYRERVEELIKAKSKGQKVTPPEEEPEEPATINLMDALKRSLKQPAAGKRASAKSSRSRRA